MANSIRSTPTAGSTLLPWDSATPTIITTTSTRTG